MLSFLDRHAGKLCILFSTIGILFIAYPLLFFRPPKPPAPKPLSTEFLEAYSYPNGLMEVDWSKPRPKNPMMFPFKPCSTFVPRVEDGEMVKVPAGWVREVTRHINREAHNE